LILLKIQLVQATGAPQVTVDEGLYKFVANYKDNGKLTNFAQAGTE
jgi:hypothetical protein